MRHVFLYLILPRLLSRFLTRWQFSRLWCSGWHCVWHRHRRRCSHRIRRGVAAGFLAILPAPPSLSLALCFSGLRMCGPRQLAIVQGSSGICVALRLWSSRIVAPCPRACRRLRCVLRRIDDVRRFSGLGCPWLPDLFRVGAWQGGPCSLWPSASLGGGRLRGGRSRSGRRWPLRAWLPRVWRRHGPHRWSSRLQLFPRHESRAWLAGLGTAPPGRCGVWAVRQRLELCSVPPVRQGQDARLGCTLAGPLRSAFVLTAARGRLVPMRRQRPISIELGLWCPGAQRRPLCSEPARPLGLEASALCLGPRPRQQPLFPPLLPRLGSFSLLLVPLEQGTNRLEELVDCLLILCLPPLCSRWKEKCGCKTDCPILQAFRHRPQSLTSVGRF